MDIEDSLTEDASCFELLDNLDMEDLETGPLSEECFDVWRSVEGITKVCAEDAHYFTTVSATLRQYMWQPYYRYHNIKVIEH